MPGSICKAMYLFVLQHASQDRSNGQFFILLQASLTGPDPFPGSIFHYDVIGLPTDDVIMKNARQEMHGSGPVRLLQAEAIFKTYCHSVPSMKSTVHLYSLYMAP